jgi:hypothetical protein
MLLRMMSKNFRNKSIIAFFFRLEISYKIANISISKKIFHLLFSSNFYFFNVYAKNKLEGKKTFLFILI